MIIDFGGFQENKAEVARICVIGAGAVGLCVAVSLAKRGKNVLLLESGGEALEPQSQALQAGKSTGHPFQNIEVGRYRLLGGSTVFWGGQLVPFDGFVRGPRPWLGHAGWPIDSAELDQYFTEAYSLLGLEQACFDDTQVWNSIGIDRPEFGEDIDCIFSRWVPTRNLAIHFKKELKHLQNLTVLLHANVCSFSMKHDLIRSVRIRNLANEQIEVSADAFVLANGTLEMSRLLMHPLTEGASAIWHKSEFLGKPLIDHLDCIGGNVYIKDHKRMHAVFDNIYLKGNKYYPRLRLSTNSQERNHLVDVGANFLYRTRFSEHLDYLKMFLRSIKDGASPVSALQLPKHLVAVAKTATPLALRYFRDRRSFKPKDAEVSLAFYCEQLPSTQSRVVLGSEVDALGMRKLEVQWQIDGREITSIRFFALKIQEALVSQGLATVEIDSMLLNEDPRFIEQMHDAIHQMGTARMADCSSKGVVDSDLKVFGTRNLYLAGAAVFPSTGFANPTLTAIALALRLVEHLSMKDKSEAVLH